jgi:hypothetical protein
MSQEQNTQATDFAGWQHQVWALQSTLDTALDWRRLPETAVLLQTTADLAVELRQLSEYIVAAPTLRVPDVEHSAEVEANLKRLLHNSLRRNSIASSDYEHLATTDRVASIDPVVVPLGTDTVGAKNLLALYRALGEELTRLSKQIIRVAARCDSQQEEVAKEAFQELATAVEETGTHLERIVSVRLWEAPRNRLVESADRRLTEQAQSLTKLKPRHYE